MANGSVSWFSSTYIRQTNSSWRWLLMHCMPCALALAFDRTGKSSEAKIPMIAITTSNSISVNALGLLRPFSHTHRHVHTFPAALFLHGHKTVSNKGSQHIHSCIPVGPSPRFLSGTRENGPFRQWLTCSPKVVSTAPVSPPHGKTPLQQVV